MTCAAAALASPTCSHSSSSSSSFVSWCESEHGSLPSIHQRHKVAGQKHTFPTNSPFSHSKPFLCTSTRTNANYSEETPDQLTGLQTAGVFQSHFGVGKDDKENDVPVAAGVDATITIQITHANEVSLSENDDESNQKSGSSFDESSKDDDGDDELEEEEVDDDESFDSIASPPFDVCIEICNDSLMSSIAEISLTDENVCLCEKGNPEVAIGTKIGGVEFISVPEMLSRIENTTQRGNENTNQMTITHENQADEKLAVHMIPGDLTHNGDTTRTKEVSFAATTIMRENSSSQNDPATKTRQSTPRPKKKKKKRRYISSSWSTAAVKALPSFMSHTRASSLKATKKKEKKSDKKVDQKDGFPKKNNATGRGKGLNSRPGNKATRKTIAALSTGKKVKIQTVDSKADKPLTRPTLISPSSQRTNKREVEPEPVIRFVVGGAFRTTKKTTLKDRKIKTSQS